MLAIIASLAAAAAAMQPTAPADAAAAPATDDPPVNVGRFNPEAFPEARMRYRRMPVNSMVSRVEALIREQRCEFPGQTLRRYDIRVPYVVKLEPDGSVSEVVVTDMNCAPLEFYVGSMVRELARRGDYRPTGAPNARWYMSEARFTVQ
jgi:hypothetical protein